MLHDTIMVQMYFKTHFHIDEFHFHFLQEFFCILMNLVLKMYGKGKICIVYFNHNPYTTAIHFIWKSSLSAHSRWESTRFTH